MGKKEKSARPDVYARITERIVAEMEQGVRPWTRPWSVGHADGRITRPLRHNGEPYTGINVLLLWSESMARGFEAPLWMTYRQASQIGAQVRKGESGTTVVYASRFTKTETDARGDEVERDIPFLKTYTLFNCNQIDDLPDHYYHRPDKIIDPVARIEHADRFFVNTGAIVRHGGSKAFYASASDHIQMPHFETFREAESYVAVLSHETVHWTSPKHRAGTRPASRSRQLSSILAQGPKGRQTRDLPGRRSCTTRRHLSARSATGTACRRAGGSLMLSLSNLTEEGDQPSTIRLRVLSLGAGVQSTTLALMAAHGEIGPMPDCAIFADTGWEPNSVYDHLDWLRSPNVLPFPVHVVSAGNIREQLIAAGEGNRWASIPAFARTVTPAGSKVPVYDEVDDGALVGSRPGAPLVKPFRSV